MASLSTLDLVSDGLLALLLIAVILFDLRQMRLPNWLALAFVGVFLVMVSWSLPWGDLVWRVGVALIVLLVGMAANAARLLGGGDVKILSALILFVPTAALLSFAFLLCVCMFVGILGLLIVRRALRDVQTGWKGLSLSARYPMGISIGAAGLIMLALS